MDLMGALKRPFSNIKKLVIGCVLYLIPIVNFIAMGYGLEAARLTFKKKKNLPEWKDWGNLFIHGLLSVVIGIVYLIPALILFAIATGIGLSSSIPLEILLSRSYYSGLIAGLMVAGPVFILAGLVLLFLVYVLPAALLGYAKRFKFSDAFTCKNVCKKAFTVNYFLAWLVSIIISAIIGLILGLIPVIGMAIAGFINLIIGLTLLAEAYK